MDASYLKKKSIKLSFKNSPGARRFKSPSVNVIRFFDRGGNGYLTTMRSFKSCAMPLWSMDHNREEDNDGDDDDNDDVIFESTRAFFSRRVKDDSSGDDAVIIKVPHRFFVSDRVHRRPEKSIHRWRRRLYIYIYISKIIRKRTSVFCHIASTFPSGEISLHIYVYIFIYIDAFTNAIFVVR
jgi:hypothetical protein